MCGIAGKLNFNGRSVAENEIKIMTDAITHRGPDDAGIFVEKNIGLGHRRLSIIDLSPAGHQPMRDSAKNIWIVFNGEIYNFKELRAELEKDGVGFKSKTDTEVIIYLYKKYGAECVKKLRGMFAFAIWDSNQEELFIARDRLGKKPLKYYYDKNSFIFASELKAILTSAEVKKETDWQAIDKYLTFGYVPNPQTGFKNIYKLEPAHYLIIKSNGEIIKKRYWDIDFSKKLNLSEVEWEEKILMKITEAVKIRTIADVPLGAHLSGGVDSGLITALMAQNCDKPITTFSVGFENYPQNELSFAKLVAQRYNTNHHELIIKPDAINIIDKIAYQYEEPYADTSAIPTWFLCEATKKQMTVALNGDGGDENFAGYERYLAINLYPKIKNIPAKLLLSIIAQKLYLLTGKKQFSRAREFLRALKNPTIENFYKQIVAKFTNAEKIKLYNPNSELFLAYQKNQQEVNLIETDKNFSADLDKFLYLGLTTHLPDQLLTKVDIASMAHGLEVRSPLLDQELVELCAQMPANLKIKNEEKKYLLKKIAGKFLPAETINHAKQGFDAPLNFWFKDANFESGLLSQINSSSQTLGIKLDKNLFHHPTKLWTLFMLSKWQTICSKQ